MRSVLRHQNSSYSHFLTNCYFREKCRLESKGIRCDSLCQKFRAYRKPNHLKKKLPMSNSKSCSINAMPPGRDGEGYSPDIQGKTPRDEIKIRGFVSSVALFFRDVYYNLPGKLSTLQNMNMVWEKLPREKIQSFDDFRGQSESRIGVIPSSNPSAASVPYITLVREKLKELNESNSDVLLNAEKHSKNNPVIYVVGTTRM